MEFAPVTLGAWLRSRACAETKMGMGLVLAAAGAALTLGSARWHGVGVADALAVSGALVLLGGLARDLLLLIRLRRGTRRGPI